MKCPYTTKEIVNAVNKVLTMRKEIEDKAEEYGFYVRVDSPVPALRKMLNFPYGLELDERGFNNAEKVAETLMSLYGSYEKDYCRKNGVYAQKVNAKKTRNRNWKVPLLLLLRILHG